MTKQIGENLIFYGKELVMDCYPPIPENHLKIKKLDLDESKINEFGELEPEFVYSTACWRGYIGTWEITKNRLFLVKVEGIYKIIGNEPIFAEWYSGILKNIYWSPFENFPNKYSLNIEIKNGIIVKTYDL